MFSPLGLCEFPRKRFESTRKGQKKVPADFTWVLDVSVWFPLD